MTSASNLSQLRDMVGLRCLHQYSGGQVMVVVVEIVEMCVCIEVTLADSSYPPDNNK